MLLRSQGALYGGLGRGRGLALAPLAGPATCRRSGRHETRRRESPLASSVPLRARAVNAPGPRRRAGAVLVRAVFERFSERSIQAVQTAQSEAKALGSPEVRRRQKRARRSTGRFRDLDLVAGHLRHGAGGLEGPLGLCTLLRAREKVSRRGAPPNAAAASAPPPAR
jgi:hypothetical protein